MKTLSFNCLFFLSFFVGCVFESSMMQTPSFLGAQDSCGFAVNHFSGEGLRWDKSKFPIVFHIHETVPVEAEKNFTSSVDHWNLVWRDFLTHKRLEPFELFYVDKRGVYEGQIKTDGNNLIAFVTENFTKYDSLSSQAITSIYAKNTSIIDTDIVVNNQTNKFYYDPQYNQTVHLATNEFEARYLASLKTPSLWFQITKKLKLFFQFLLRAFKKPSSVRKIANFRSEVPKDRVDFPSLMIHELGHVPGRAHFKKDSPTKRQFRSRTAGKKSDSVMEPKLEQGKARRGISQIDLESLFCAYYNY